MDLIDILDKSFSLVSIFAPLDENGKNLPIQKQTR